LPGGCGGVPIDLLLGPAADERRAMADYRQRRLVGSLVPNPWGALLLVDGVWTGVGSVLVFLPQILLLFLFIGILEDSG